MPYKFGDHKFDAGFKMLAFYKFGVPMLKYMINLMSLAKIIFQSFWIVIIYNYIIIDILIYGYLFHWTCWILDLISYCRTFQVVIYTFILVIVWFTTIHWIIHCYIMHGTLYSGVEVPTKIYHSMEGTMSLGHPKRRIG